MPTSTYSHIPTVVRYLQKVMPSSILDIGLGNGKMGFIARDFLDVMLGERHRREDWKINNYLEQLQAIAKHRSV